MTDTKTKYWYVLGGTYDVSGVVPFLRCFSYEEAETEAKRMASQKRDGDYYILESIAVAHLPTCNIEVTKL